MVYEKLCDIIESDIHETIKNLSHSALFIFAQMFSNEMLDVLKKRLQLDVGKSSPIFSLSKMNIPGCGGYPFAKCFLMRIFFFCKKFNTIFHTPNTFIFMKLKMVDPKQTSRNLKIG